MSNIEAPHAGLKAGRFLRSKNRLLALAAVLVLLVVSAARPMAQAPLRTYTSADGQFQIRYPSTFTLHVNEVSVAGTNVYHPVQNIIELDAPDQPRPYILIEYQFNMRSDTLDEFIDNSSECDEITGQPGQNVLVAGTQGRVFRNIDCNSDGETRIYVLNGDVGYNIILRGKPVDEQMLGFLLSNFAPASQKPKIIRY